ncbi:predicted protein [Pyrenophora tritici-repentis Pt-1C-BFP]|uniref:Uncharacterized protein n=1 Tax=Pyrenophora tritici-repentis (strain Pt-1C-BFP) TaxID=426418 RepID=B2VXY8_PYRTR|nr:uncharacterized protein PTRG_03376 [Pyrenophora tritici-repentis Pt-1C-BFP]EDU45899.1 predicted protein [Pyrenophora tritici-repentis Pt-1C-BFP]
MFGHYPSPRLGGLQQIIRHASLDVCAQTAPSRQQAQCQAALDGGGGATTAPRNSCQSAIVRFVPSFVATDARFVSRVAPVA